MLEVYLYGAGAASMCFWALEDFEVCEWLHCALFGFFWPAIGLALAVEWMSDAMEQRKKKQEVS